MGLCNAKRVKWDSGTEKKMIINLRDDLIFFADISFFLKYKKFIGERC